MAFQGVKELGAKKCKKKMKKMKESQKRGYNSDQGLGFNNFGEEK